MTKFVLRISIVLLFAPYSGHAASDASGSLSSFLGQNGFQNINLNRRFPNWLSIPVKINQKSGALVVATGCPITGIDRESVAKFGLIEKKTTMRVGGSLGRSNERYGMSELKTLDVASSSFNDVSVAVLNA